MAHKVKVRLRATALAAAARAPCPTREAPRLRAHLRASKVLADQADIGKAAQGQQGHAFADLPEVIPEQRQGSGLKLQQRLC